MLRLHRFPLQHLVPRPLYIVPRPPLRRPPLAAHFLVSRSHSTSMTTPVASSSQPAQIPALENPHQEGTKKSKDKKAKDTGSAHPLEVC